MRVWRPGPAAGIEAHQGCLSGPPDAVRAALQRRRDKWAADRGEALADLWLSESLAMLDAGVAYVTARAELAVEA